MSYASALTSASSYCAKPFGPAKVNIRPQRLRSTQASAQATQQGQHKKVFTAGLALVASVPLIFGGSAEAFVGNTAKDFSEKVDRYTPSPSDIKDVAEIKVEQATPDVPLPGQKQKGKEASAIGKAPAQSGPGAADQVKGAAKDAAESTGAKGALEQVKPKRGLIERINDEALTENAPSVQFGK